MKILITGGLGYLGGRLAQHLVTKTNHDVILGTRKKTTPPEWLPQVKIVNTLWNSETNLERICSDVDVVVHMAGMNASDCAMNPRSALEFNGFATERLLQSAIKQRVKRFIKLSSAHIYSNLLTGRITEETYPKNLHPYATSHRVGEDVVRLAHSRNEIEGIVIRLSNSFGAPAHINTNCWTLVTNDLCVQAINNGHMILNSPEKQRRDFITISDVCRAIEHLIMLPVKQLSDGLFNVGGEWSPTILEVAQLLSSRINLITAKKNDIQINTLKTNQSFPSLDYDINKIKTTDFKLIKNVNHEIDNLIRFCLKHYG